MCGSKSIATILLILIMTFFGRLHLVIGLRLGPIGLGTQDLYFGCNIFSWRFSDQRNIYLSYQARKIFFTSSVFSLFNLHSSVFSLRLRCENSLIPPQSAEQRDWWCAMLLTAMLLCLLAYELMISDSRNNKIWHIHCKAKVFYSFFLLNLDKEKIVISDCEC